MRKHGLKALGLCLMAALGLMAFGSVAQAAPPEWTITGVGTLEGTEEIKGVQTTSQLLKSKAGKVDIEIHCNELSTDDGLIFGNKTAESGTSLGTILYKGGCITKLAGKETPICKPVEPIEAKVRNLLILHEKQTFILFEPREAGKPFTEIKFGAGECSVPTTPVTGEIIFQCLEPAGTQVDCSTLREKQLISPASTTLFSGTNGLPLSQALNFGVNPATLTGSASLALSGVHEKAGWGGLG